MGIGNDVSLWAIQRHTSRIHAFARAVLAGLRKWSNCREGFPAAPRSWTEALEARQLLSNTAFSVSIAAPPTVTANQQFYIYVWTAGGTMASTAQYTVDEGDGTIEHVSPSTSRVTAIPITYNFSGGIGAVETITVSATDSLKKAASQTCGMDNLGNYPAENGGPTTFVPSGASSSTPSSIVVDPGTGYTYVAETYYTTGGGSQMALTRLDSNDLPDTAWGTYVSGSTYTGTLVVPAFGGGSTGDVAYAAAVGDFPVQGGGSIDEVAIAGNSANGMAAAIINLGGTGSVLKTSDYGGQTMPAGYAYAVTFDDSGDVVLAGTDNTQSNMVAVGLIGSGTSAGQLDSSFGQNADGVTTFGFGGTTNAVAQAIMQVPAGNGNNEELVLGGWCSAGCGACSTQCNMIVVGLTDAQQSFYRGYLDTGNFGRTNGTGSHTGYNDVNLGAIACMVGWNGCYGCYGCSACGIPSNDSVYSLVWDDDLSDIVAIGDTDYSGTNQPVLWGLSQTGQADTTSPSLDANRNATTGFGGLGTIADGVAVPNIDVNVSTRVTGAVATQEGSAIDGNIYLAGTYLGGSADLLLGRYYVPNHDNSGSDTFGMDPTFGFSSSGPGEGTGYFQQDLGSATSPSSDYSVGVAEENDGSVVLLASTDSPGGSTAVIRYNAMSAITVQPADTPPMMSLAAVQAASQPSATLPAGPAITWTTNLSSLDASNGSNPAHKRRVARRLSVAPGASPPSSSTVLVTPSS